jgi:hypothetical protein
MDTNDTIKARVTTFVRSLATSGVTDDEALGLVRGFLLPLTGVTLTLATGEKRDVPANPLINPLATTFTLNSATDLSVLISFTDGEVFKVSSVNPAINGVKPAVSPILERTSKPVVDSKSVTSFPPPLILSN